MWSHVVVPLRSPTRALGGTQSHALGAVLLQWLAGGHAEAGVLWRPGTPQKLAFGWRVPSASLKLSSICTHA